MDLKDLVNNPKQFEAWKNASPNAQKLVIKKLQSGISDGATDLVIKKLIMRPIQIGEEGTDIPTPWKDVPVSALKNIPSSTIQFGKDIAQVAIHPVATGLAIEDMIIGGFQKLIPGKQKREAGFDAAVGFFKDRYGSVENLKQTIINDPVGFLSDVGAMLTGVGGAAKQVPALAKAGKVVSKAGQFMDASSLAGKGVSKFAAKETIRGIPEKAISRIKTAIKPIVKGSTRISDHGLAKMDNLAAEMLLRGKDVSRKTTRAFQEGINQNKARVEDILRTATKKGVKIPVDDVVSGVDGLLNEIENLPVKTKKNATQVKVLRDYKEQLLGSRKPTASQALKGEKAFLTPLEVQELKLIGNKTYKVNTVLLKDAVSAVADDAVRQATKEALESSFPELAALNKDTGIMIELQSTISKRVLQLESGQLSKARGLIAGAGGGAAAGLLGFGGGVTSIPESLLAAGAFGVGSFVVDRMLQDPNIQIKIARAMNAANKQLARAGKLGTVTRPGFQAGRIGSEIRNEAEKQEALDSQRLQPVSP